MKNQHQVAQILDRCAERADFIDLEPATQKQCWYLAKLMLDAGDDGGEFMLDAGDDGGEFVLNTSAILTKQDASQRIEALLGGAA
jgi:hypothetical protein